MARHPSGLSPAPLHEDVADGRDGGAAFWLKTRDGTRIRLGLWPAAPAKGTVLMFPGRTEYIEKYGRLARDFVAAGYAMAAIDWRGQGLADRPAFRRDIGHVDSFDEYRQDVAAMRTALETLDVPKPWFLIAHSMGGAIGLRALHDGLPVARVVFSAPMWGIQMTVPSRLFADILRRVAGPLGFDTRFTPSTGPAGPLMFEGNRLTSDTDQFAYMEHQTATYPDLALGGPSIRWLSAALRETSALMEMPAPKIDALTFLGSREQIVAIEPVRGYMARWPKGELIPMDGAKHEILMEVPAHRDVMLRRMLTFFESA